MYSTQIWHGLLCAGDSLLLNIASSVVRKWFFSLFLKNLSKLLDYMFQKARAWSLKMFSSWEHEMPSFLQPCFWPGKERSGWSDVSCYQGQNRQVGDTDCVWKFSILLRFEQNIGEMFYARLCSLRRSLNRGGTAGIQPERAAGKYRLGPCWEIILSMHVVVTMEQVLLSIRTELHTHLVFSWNNPYILGHFSLH